MKKQKEAPEPVSVFDGGFFKVASPAKSPKVHCEGNTKSILVYAGFTHLLLFVDVLFLRK